MSTKFKKFTKEESLIIQSYLDDRAKAFKRMLKKGEVFACNRADWEFMAHLVGKVLKRDVERSTK